MDGRIEVDLGGKTAIVTGAARGLGRAFAEAYARAGAAVLVADLDANGGEATANAIVKSGGRAAFCATDVSNEASVARMAASAIAAFGRIDILVANAGRYAGLERRRFDKIPPSEWRSVMAVNVDGPYLCARAVVADMLSRRWGRIIHISSSTVAMGRENFLHYVTSKAAVYGMTHAMARELGGDGITVNAIMPGLTETEGTAVVTSDAMWNLIVGRQAIPRREVPADLIGIALFLASDSASFLTGQTIPVDGGAVHL